MPAFDLTNILTVFIWSIGAAWLVALLWTRLCLEKLKPLKSRKTLEINEKPFVSVVVPARNEAGRVLEKSIGSMLAQTYENFEIVVLDDRSTDDTRAVIEKIFAEQPENRKANCKIIDGIEPPVGWLGKPFALEQTLEHARGAWILAADADIIFAPDALATVVEYAEKNRFDALTLAPRLVYKSFWETLFMPTFAWFCLLAMPLHRANDAKRKQSIGFGNFFMFRRDVLDKISGFAAVKSEVAEDLKLAEILKIKGFNLRADYAPDLIETRMYAGFGEIWKGFTKNLFSGMKFSIPKTVFSLISIFAFGVAPVFAALLALFFGRFDFFASLVLVYILQVVVFIPVQKKWLGNSLFAFLAPFGLLMFLLILANSMLKVLSGAGVEWKGRAIYERGGVKPK